MSMIATATPKATLGTQNTALTKLEAHVLGKQSPTYTAYYNGKMSYALHGKAWETYIAEAFPDLKSQVTSENIFKAVIDLYAERA